MKNASISMDRIAAMRNAFAQNGERVMRMNAVTKTGMDSAIAFDAPIRTPNTFSHELKSGDVTAQNGSGRCWLFAATNILRLEVMKKCDLETFEISQAYLFFWDKFEKANYYLESVIETVDEPLDSRIIAWLLSAPFNDGGQWDMVVALVEKYGVVPKNVMPESFSTGSSGAMNKILTLKAREYARDLRNAHKAGATREALAQKKASMMDEIFGILCTCMGVPPMTFDFEVRGKEGKFTRQMNMTPQAFYSEYVGTPLKDYVSLINSPTTDKPFYQTYTVSFLGNVIEGDPILYLNLPIENVKRAALAQLMDGRPVWFGSDVGQMHNREHGLMDMDAYDYGAVFMTNFGLNKGERLQYGESLMTHAMVFTGVNELDGTPNRWKVENSWGEKAGVKGWFRMSDAWFDEYVYQIVVDKRYLAQDELSALSKAPIALNPWDPMGSLA